MATFGSEHSEWISGILEQFNSKIDGDVFVRGGLVFIDPVYIITVKVKNNTHMPSLSIYTVKSS